MSDKGLTPRQVLDAAGHHHVSVRITPPMPDRECRFGPRDLEIACTMAARQPTSWTCEGVLRQGDDVTLLVSTREARKWAADHAAMRNAADALLRTVKDRFGADHDVYSDLDSILTEWWADAHDEHMRRLEDERLRREGL